MKLSELKKYIEENIVEILDETISIDVPDPKRLTPTAKQGLVNKTKAATGDNSAGTATNPIDFFEAKDEDEEVEDTYGKEDEDDKKDAKIANAEPSKAELKKLDKEFSSTKLAKALSPADKERLDKLESGIKKKLANPTKDNIEIVRQLIKKPEIKKLFKDGGKDLKALISDVIR